MSYMNNELLVWGTTRNREEQKHQKKGPLGLQKYIILLTLYSHPILNELGGLNIKGLYQIQFLLSFITSWYTESFPCTYIMHLLYCISMIMILH